jgi:hypothetical protein
MDAIMPTTRLTCLALRTSRAHIERMATNRPAPLKITPIGTPAAVERAALRSWDNEGGAPSGGAPSTRPSEKFGLSVELVAAVDRWAKQQDDRPARSEAIRHLLETALAGSIEGPRSRKSRRKATDMAGEQIDRIGDPTASSEERETRKQRLLKGPNEFRGARARQRGD